MRAISQDDLGGPEVLKEVRTDKARATADRGARTGPRRRAQPDRLEAPRHAAAVCGEPPFVLGWDVSGVVEEVGTA